MKRLIQYTLFFVVLLMLSILGEGLISSAHAKKIHRTCFGGYNVEVYVWITSPGAPRKGKKIGETGLLHLFQARGGCGKSVPNRCRDRARSYGKSCMRSHYTSKRTIDFPIGQVPDQCGLEDGILNYPPGKLIDLLDNAVCSLVRRKDYGQYQVFYTETSARVSCKYCRKTITDFTTESWLLDDAGVDAGRLVQCN